MAKDKKPVKEEKPTPTKDDEPDAATQGGKCTDPYNPCP